jgi:addiction module RelE/StbE family toxin
MIHIVRTSRFEKELEKLALQYSNIVNQVEDVLILFRNNPEDTRLRNHPLRRRMEGKYAFSIDEDIRVIYEWVRKNQVKLLNIGTHKQVYRVKSSVK